MSSQVLGPVSINFRIDGFVETGAILRNTLSVLCIFTGLWQAPGRMEVDTMITAQEAPWFALHVRSRHEKSVFAQLEAKSQDVFLPCYTTRSKWADRIKDVSLPLFPGYVFCRFDPGMRSKVLATSGVIDVVRAGRDPAPISPSEIEAIQRVVLTPIYTEPYSSIAVGQRVHMCAGPLTGLTGSIIEVRKQLRLVLSVELLNRSILVEIDRDWVVLDQAIRLLALT